ncbi:MAG: hypothetical protein WKF76_08870 [Nocardioidaceae bacterium]
MLDGVNLGRIGALRRNAHAVVSRDELSVWRRGRAIDPEVVTEHDEMAGDERHR